MEVSFDLLLVDIPEVVLAGEAPEVYSQRITQEKMAAAWDCVLGDNLPVMPVLCADTEVVLDGVILGKPEDKDAAFRMLKSYANRTHEVITSVGLRYYDYDVMMMDRTLVTFADLRDEDIHHYLTSDNYKDKSGSYGIQSYIGQFISRIDGCFYSVMGLPLNTVRVLLQDFKEKCSV
jgi:septum formation protein